jgi:hypothetical protein|tara:strand:+ start:455 stop:616 length:162 start_codon:yes stop_codon:yes gene_type:complete
LTFYTRDTPARQTERKEVSRRKTKTKKKKKKRFRRRRRNEDDENAFLLSVLFF